MEDLEKEIEDFLQNPNNKKLKKKVKRLIRKINPQDRKKCFSRVIKKIEFDVEKVLEEEGAGRLLEKIGTILSIDTSFWTFEENPFPEFIFSAVIFSLHFLLEMIEKGEREVDMEAIRRNILKHVSRLGGIFRKVDSMYENSSWITIGPFLKFLAQLCTLCHKIKVEVMSSDHLTKEEIRGLEVTSHNIFNFRHQLFKISVFQKNRNLGDEYFLKELLKGLFSGFQVSHCQVANELSLELAEDLFKSEVPINKSEAFEKVIKSVLSKYRFWESKSTEVRREGFPLYEFRSFQKLRKIGKRLEEGNIRISENGWLFLFLVMEYEISFAALVENKDVSELMNEQREFLLECPNNIRQEVFKLLSCDDMSRFQVLGRILFCSLLIPESKTKIEVGRAFEMMINLMDRFPPYFYFMISRNNVLGEKKDSNIFDAFVKNVFNTNYEKLLSIQKFIWKMYYRISNSTLTDRFLRLVLYRLVHCILSKTMVSKGTNFMANQIIQLIEESSLLYSETKILESKNAWQFRKMFFYRTELLLKMLVSQSLGIYKKTILILRNISGFNNNNFQQQQLQKIAIFPSDFFELLFDKVEGLQRIFLESVSRILDTQVKERRRDSRIVLSILGLLHLLRRVSSTIADYEIHGNVMSRIVRSMLVLQSDLVKYNISRNASFGEVGSEVIDVSMRTTLDFFSALSRTDPTKLRSFSNECISQIKNFHWIVLNKQNMAFSVFQLLSVILTTTDISAQVAPNVAQCVMDIFSCYEKEEPIPRAFRETMFLDSFINLLKEIPNNLLVEVKGKLSKGKMDLIRAYRSRDEEDEVSVDFHEMGVLYEKESSKIIGEKRKREEEFGLWLEQEENRITKKRKIDHIQKPEVSSDVVINSLSHSVDQFGVFQKTGGVFSEGEKKRVKGLLGKLNRFADI